MPLMTAAIPIQQPRMRFFDAEGKPLVGGKVYSYKIGTDLFRPTFRDANKTALNQNPVVLDEAGSALIYLNGSHLLKVFDKFDNFIEMRYLPVTEMRTYFYDKLGKPLKYGKVETYDIASTIKKASYQNSEKTVLNTNPVILDENGSAIICIVGSYRLRVYDEKNVFLWDEDFLRNVAFALTSKIYPLFFDEAINVVFIPTDAKELLTHFEDIATNFNIQDALIRDQYAAMIAEPQSINMVFSVNDALIRNQYLPLPFIPIDGVNPNFTFGDAVIRNSLITLNPVEPHGVSTSFAVGDAKFTP